ncbi:hypothetical protein D0865_05908 [Hortaea werneckii]|uniref:Uncharacterized protein n=1 Tax=Hortaea werneckii TaxID=91943 RepID=A0A3M7CJQ9_HORWE|nr:hypothetical protein D0865_05908 [Hortaea werneckii]
MAPETQISSQIRQPLEEHAAEPTVSLPLPRQKHNDDAIAWFTTNESAKAATSGGDELEDTQISSQTRQPLEEHAAEPIVALPLPVK